VGFTLKKAAWHSSASHRMKLFKAYKQPSSRPQKGSARQASKQATHTIKNFKAMHSLERCGLQSPAETAPFRPQKTHTKAYKQPSSRPQKGSARQESKQATHFIKNFKAMHSFERCRLQLSAETAPFRPQRTHAKAYKKPQRSPSKRQRSTGLKAGNAHP
jgi:beta-mannanase